MISDQWSDKAVEREFDRALGLRDAGEVDTALKILAELAAKRPDLAYVVGMLASVQFQAGYLDASAASASRAVQLSPSSEMASRCLFHSLYDLGRYDEAFAEVARFRSNKQSDEYEITLCEIVEDATKELEDCPENKVAQAIRQKVREEIGRRLLGQVCLLSPMGLQEDAICCRPN